LISGSSDSSIKSWNIAGSDESSVLTYVGHTSAVNSLDWNPTTEQSFLSAGQDKSVKVWDQRKKIFTQTISVNQPVYSVNWNKDGNTFLIGEESGAVQIFDIRSTKEALFSLSLHKDSVRVALFSPHSGNLIATASDDAHVFVYDLEKKEQIYQAQHSDFVRGLSWHTEKKGILASGSWDKTVQIHSLA